MKRILLICLLSFFTHGINAQFHLVVNEFSQGNGGTREFVELLVVGTRTCTDSTADIRNWIFDDQNGWYGAAGTGIAVGHYRFANNPNWQKVPYGSIILIYNSSDRNGNIPSGVDDPTDSNQDHVYIVPINNNLLEQNTATPASPSAANYTYPTTGYVPSGGWSSFGLSNSGDGVIVTDPANPGIAHFSIIFGFTAGGGFQVPTVTKGNVAANKNCYLNDNLYSNAASWIVGNAGTADETPGTGNSPANIAWIQAMRLQAAAITPVSTTIQPTCTSPTGTITVNTPLGTGYTYSIDGVNFQSSPVFPGVTANTYTITVLAPGGCTATSTAVINPAPGSPIAPEITITQPTCTVTTGTITITNPVGATYSYSMDGINFQANPVFSGLVPNTYTITVKAGAGCTSTGTAIVTAAPGSPIAPETTVTQPTCTVSTGTITITNPVGATYSYSIDGINFQASPVFPGLVPNTYTITVKAGAGCTSTGTAIVNVAPGSPIAPESSIIQPTCTITTGTITITNPVGAAYSYSIDGINFQVNPVFPGLVPNTYAITVKSGAGCTSTSTAVVNNAENFILNLIASPNPAAQGSLVSLNTSSVSAYQVIAWLPQASFANQTAISQSISAGSSAVYFAVGKSSNGCIDTAQVSLSVTPATDDIFIPNVFTPNNDGKNDQLYVYGNSIKAIDFRIFNQWGEAIFRTADKSQGWDGRYNGKLQPVAVYIYVVKATMQNGSIITKKGSVTIVR